VLRNINRKQEDERANNAVFVPGDLDLWPWHSDSSERETKHVFPVNLAQIRSAVPKIYHTQTKSYSQRQNSQKQNLSHSQFTACGNKILFGRPLQVTVRPMLCDRCPVCPVCPVCLSVTVHCGQRVGWIKMPLGTEVGLGTGDILLDGNSAPSPRKGARPPTFRPMFIVAIRSPSQQLLSSF